MTIPTDGFPPGAYTVALAGPGAPPGATPVDVVAPAAERRVILPARTVRQNVPIAVRWRNGEGNRYDWIAVTKAGKPPRVAPLKAWRYVGGRVRGSAAIVGKSHGSWPLRTGRYDVALCTDDGYVCSRPARLRVRP